MSFPSEYRQVVVKEFSPSFRQATTVRTLPFSTLLNTLNTKANGVLVKIHYTTARASDRNDCSGRYGVFSGMPFVAGMEAVGRVLKVGDQVKRVKVGDAVGMLLLKRGGAQEFAVVEEGECFVLPSAIQDFVAFFNAGLTSMCGLILPSAAKMRISPQSPLSKYFPENIDTSTPYNPEIVVITAAAGGVGLMASQLVVAGGNIAVGLASSDEKLTALKKLGVQYAVNYKAHGTPAELARYIKGLVGREVDVVWETVGGEMLEALSGITGKGGRVVIIGQISLGYGEEKDAKERQSRSSDPALGRTMLDLLTGSNPHRDRALEHLKSKGAAMTRYFLGTGAKGANPYEQFGKFVGAEVGLWKEGVLKGVTDDRMGFKGIEKYVDAVEYLHAGKNVGKPVVKVHEDSEVGAGSFKL